MNIPTQNLHPAPQNPNVCSPETLEKLKRNIERTGFYPPLIARPHPDKTKHFMLIDGYHRLQVLKTLGHKSIECMVWEISEQEAQLALATLNTLRGTDNPRKRAELLASLTKALTVEDLANLLPENQDEIRDMLRLLDVNFEELEQSLQKQLAKEMESLPVALTFLVSKAEEQVVNDALAQFTPDTKTSKTTRAEALISICKYALDQKG